MGINGNEVKWITDKPGIWTIVQALVASAGIRKIDVRAEGAEKSAFIEKSGNWVLILPGDIIIVKSELVTDVTIETGWYDG